MKSYLIRYKIIFSLFFFCVLPPFFAQNILFNGGFEEGQGDWSTYFETSSGYNGNLSIVSNNVHSGDKAAKISITQVSNNPQVLKAQLKNNLFHIESGHSYQVSVWMKSNSPVDVQIILIKNTSPWTWLGAKTVTLTSSYQMFDFYTGPSFLTTDNDVRFAIRCGNSVADIYVDDVVITDCTSPINYTSLHTSVTGKGTIEISNGNITQNCIEFCNDQFLNGTLISLTASPEQGYVFDGWSGACSGNGNCQITMDQLKSVGAHFSLLSSDNSCLNYRNQTNWKIAGFQGIIPYDGNIIDMTQPPYNCIGDGINNNYQSILNVLSDVKTIPGFNIIYFPAGTYYIEGKESFFIPENTVIRGECSSNTTLEINSIADASPYTTNKIFRIEQIGSQSTKFGPETSLKGGFYLGSKVLTIDDSTVINTGDFIEIRQHNDTVKMASDRVPFQISNSTWQNAYNTFGADAVGEIARVVDKNGNNIILDRSLHHTYDPKLYPMIKRIGLIENAGIENIKIYRPNGNKDNMNIGIERAYNCWVRNVESSWAMKCHVSLVRSYHCEIRDNYIHHAYDYGGGGHGYGVSVNHRATSCLIEHNAFKTLRHAMVLSYGPIGNVLGYNFSTDSNDPSANFGLGDIKADISIHGFYPTMNLFEGNIVEFIHSSDWWGPSGPGNTFYRNRATHQPLTISDNSHYQNVIGNELTYNPIGWADNFEIESSVNHTTKHSNNDQGNIDVNKIFTLGESLYQNNSNFNYGFPMPNIGPINGLNPSGDYPFNMHDNKAKHRYDNSSNKAPCLNSCSSNVFPDTYSSCETSVDLYYPQSSSNKILYGVIVEDIPNTYGGFTEGDPEIYIKIYNSNGTLVFTSENNYISADPDIYISCDFLQIDTSETYTVHVYDDDGITSGDDFLGTVTFQGNSNSSYFYNYVSGNLLQIQLVKENYTTQLIWNDGSTNNPITINQSGTYSVIAINNYGCKSSDTIDVTLNQPPQIISESISFQETCDLNSINPYSITTTGGVNISYQWYSNTSNSYSGANPINGANSSSFLPAPTTYGDYYYFCYISDTNTSCDNIYSSIGNVRVNDPISITNQPITNQMTCENGSVNPLAVNVSGGGTITYQWYQNTNNSVGNGNPISGATNSSYLPSSQNIGTLYYYCEISSSGFSCPSTISSISEVVIEPQIIITTQPISLQEVCINDSLVNLNVSCSTNLGLNYQWFSNTTSSTSGGSAIFGANTSTFTPLTNSPGTQYYYCVISSNTVGCFSTYSNISEIHVIESIELTTQPISYNEVCTYDTLSFISVTTNDTSHSIQWYVNSINSYLGAQSMQNNSSSALQTFSATEDSLFYFCIVSNGICNNDTSLISTIVYTGIPTSSFSFLNNNLSINFTNNSQNGSSYLWDFGDGNTSTSYEPTHTYANNGNYNVMLITYNNCSSDTTMLNIEVFSNTIAENPQIKVEIYPNPTIDGCTFKVAENNFKKGKLKIVNSAGKTVKKISISTKTTLIRLEDLEAGEYLFHFQSKNKTILKKVIKL